MNLYHTLFLLLIFFSKSYESFSLIDEKTESKPFLHNFYVQFYINNSFMIKLKPSFNTHYILINSSLYNFSNSTTYKRLNNEKIKINISNNLFYGYESTDYIETDSNKKVPKYDFPFLLITENKIYNNENYYPSFLGLAPGNNLKMNFMNYLTNKSNISANILSVWKDNFDFGYNSYNNSNNFIVKPLNVYSLEYEFYKIDYGNFYSSIKLPNKVTFTVDSDFFILPYKYFNQIKKIIKEEYFNKDYCYEEIDLIKKYYHYIRCNSQYFLSYNIYKTNNYLRFFPFSSYSHLYISFNESSLYGNAYYNTRYFKIMFDDRENIFDGWIIGRVLQEIKFDFKTGDFIYNNNLTHEIFDESFEIVFIIICIIITILIILICFICSRTIKFKILKFCELSLIFFYVNYFFVMIEFTERYSFGGIFDILISFIILLPGFIVIVLKLTYNYRNSHSYYFTSHYIILTRLIFLGIYLVSIILILLFTHYEMSFFSKVYSGSLIIFFILDNGFDIYVAKHPKNNNENLSINLERII